MNARHLIPLAVLVAAATAVATAADMPADATTVEGTVVMLTPAVLQLGTDQGTIQEFEVTADSQIDDRVTQGDRVTVWYRDVGGSKVVVRYGAVVPRESEPATAAGNRQVEGARATGSTGSRSHADMGSASGSTQGPTGTGDTSWYDKEGTPYPEAVNPPDNAIVGRQGPMRLPHTASLLPTAGALGLAALAAATALAMLRRRI